MMRTLFSWLVLLVGVAACSTQRDDLARLWRADPDLADEVEWTLASEPLREEIAALEKHSWAGQYQTPRSDSSTELLLTPHHGWASRTWACEPPHGYERGQIRLSDRGPIFLDEKGVELDDLSFEVDILMTLQSVLHSVEFLAECIEDDPATYGTPSDLLAVNREIARLRRVIHAVSRARR